MLENQGNVDLLFNLEASDPAQLLDFSLPAQVGIPAGESESLEFQIAPRHPRLVGRPESIDFELTVMPALPIPGNRTRTSSVGGRRTPTGPQIPLSDLGPVVIKGRYSYKPPPPGFRRSGAVNFSPAKEPRADNGAIFCRAVA